MLKEFSQFELSGRAKNKYTRPKKRKRINVAFGP